MSMSLNLDGCLPAASIHNDQNFDQHQHAKQHSSMQTSIQTIAYMHSIPSMHNLMKIGGTCAGCDGTGSFQMQ